MPDCLVRGFYVTHLWDLKPTLSSIPLVSTCHLLTNHKLPMSCGDCFAVSQICFWALEKNLTVKFWRKDSFTGAEGHFTSNVRKSQTNVCREQDIHNERTDIYADSRPRWLEFTLTVLYKLPHPWRLWIGSHNTKETHCWFCPTTCVRAEELFLMEVVTMYMLSCKAFSKTVYKFVM